MAFIDKLPAIIEKKSTSAVLITFGFLVAVGLLKWWIHPPVDAIWYLIGGILGIYFLDGAEVFFDLTPSPFRSIIFSLGLGVVSLFVVTSSGSLLATGLIFSLLLTIVFWQADAWRQQKNLNSWYTMIAGPVSLQMQQIFFWCFVGLLIIEAFLFIR